MPPSKIIMEKSNLKSTKLCPTCGTRVAENAPRCLVCGTEFLSQNKKAGKINTPTQSKSFKVKAPQIRGTRMPELTLSVPVILILIIVFLSIGAGMVYFGLQATGAVVAPTEAPTETLTPTPSLTPTPITPTSTSTRLPTLEPRIYRVQTGDSCGSIAYLFDISIQSIILENNLAATCPLSINYDLRIPYPTATLTPEATNTPSSIQATRDACDVDYYTVVEGDDLSTIAFYRGVSPEAIMEWNGKTIATVFVGETLAIPLCLRNYVAGVGTVTPTPAPPKQKPELLLPNDGQGFTLENDIVTLQWASVGTLLNNEFYQVTVVNVTEGDKEPLVFEVSDTKFTVPTEYRPTNNSVHIFRWWVMPVAKVGVNSDGSPIYISGGPASDFRNFSWSGSAPETNP